MTEETAEIQRLDYSKPPPGYEALRLDGEEMYRRPGCRLLPLNGPYGAWAFFKKDNDPPGLFEYGNAFSAWGNIAFLGVDTSGAAPPLRAAAWVWYERRLALAGRLEATLLVDEEMFRGRSIRTVVPASEAQYFDGTQERYSAWPRCLTWSDDQVAAVERWLADSTAELPEVLRG